MICQLIFVYFLVVKHVQAVNSFRRRWRRREGFVLAQSNSHSSTNTIHSTNNKPAEFDEIDCPEGQSTGTDWKPFGRSNSVSCLSNYFRIDLFLAGITRYVSYSDKLRDLSFEVRTSNANSLVIQCTNEEICLQWQLAIKSTIDSLTDSFVCWCSFYCCCMSV